ncbi:hypothetical protein MM239_12410 [Belliella sp. DSM 111904]|uniref:Phage integrase SAM-like domain-containing protein n=1 Tax=Belliella filtrata TaxID=2923435 RepID=A0ABS9V1A9_9BACT|nr:hypothetical protein [Belliella filtrata]MCH7410202.1 hypothetical protein [Belliella filtrata]
MAWTISLFRHKRKKKDGTFQIKLKIRNRDLKFQYDFPIEYKVAGKKKKLSLSLDFWNNLSKNNKKIIYVAEHRYKEILFFLENNNVPITPKSIRNLYIQEPFDITKENEIEKIKHLLSYELSEKEISEYSGDQLIGIANSLDDLQIGNDEILQEDQVGTLLILAEEHNRKKEELNKARNIENNLDRCDAQYKITGYYDYTRIIDAFGYYWTLKRINDSRYLTKYDGKIVLRVAQFIFLTGASNRVEDLNHEWVKSYFLHLKNYGFLDTRKIRNYTPLELYDYKDLIIENQHRNKIYSLESYVDQIKKFKKYFRTLRKKTTFFDSIPKLDLDDFDINSLKNIEADYEQVKTQKDHYLNVEELEIMSGFKSDNEELNLTRDLFFIQTFSSGNRSIEKDLVAIKVHKGITYFEVKHSKTKSKNVNGQFKYLREVLTRYNYILPEIKMNSRQYNENLKKIAEELNFNRKIEHVVNKINSKATVYNYIPLKKCISQYYSRHTLVNYLVDGGTKDTDIIKITGHVNTDILDHYKKNVTVQEKQKIIDIADKNNQSKS